jgi:hypothetical protein
LIFRNMLPPRYSPMSAIGLPFDSGHSRREPAVQHILQTGAAICSELLLFGDSARDIGRHVSAAITARFRQVFDPYRPELHYMRGPGPKWYEKHGLAARSGGARRVG